MHTRFAFCTRLAALAAVAAALSSAPVVNADDTLEWKFKAGDKSDFVLISANDMLIDAGGIEFEIEMKQILGLSWEVKSVADDGTAEITQTIARLRLSLSTPFTGELEHDSTNEEVPTNPAWQMIAPMFDLLVGAEVNMKIGKDGNISDITLPEEMLEALAEQGGDSGRSMMMGGGITEGSVKEMIRMAVPVLPGSPVAEGAEWKQSIETDLGPVGVQTTDVTYKYEGMEGDNAKISVNTVVALELKEDEDSEADIELEIAEQESEGTVLFDTKTGRLVELKIVQTLVMEGYVMGNEIYQEREGTTILKPGTIDDVLAEEEEESDSEEEE